MKERLRRRRRKRYYKYAKTKVKKLTNDPGYSSLNDYTKYSERASLFTAT
jgi:hypothetical protein